MGIAVNLLVNKYQNFLHKLILAVVKNLSIPVSCAYVYERLN